MKEYGIIHIHEEINIFLILFMYDEEISNFVEKRKSLQIIYKVIVKIMPYNLGYISDADIYAYVKSYVDQYKKVIDLKSFNSNIVDPIKLTFDHKIYGKTIAQTIEDECNRQIDKANSNVLGYFHQNFFKLFGNLGWTVPSKGFDIENNNKHIYVEMKNKHNTMNAASSRDTYLVMLNKVNADPLATCMLVEVIAQKSQNIRWEGTFKGQFLSNNRIRRVSIDKFYEIVFNDKDAFHKLCVALPTIIDDILANSNGPTSVVNTVISQLNSQFSGSSNNLLTNLYLLAFKTYEGF